MTSPLYKSPIPLNYLDTDTAMTANSDVKVPTQKAVKAYADTKAPALGADDNYATDAEKTKLSNLSGTNTGDEVVATQAEVATGTDPDKMVTPLGLSKFHIPPDGFLYNGKIVPSVSSNDLIVAIKGMDGNDPSATNPVYVRIANTVYSITSALSVTHADGLNWFNAGSANFATLECDYFVYIGYASSLGAIKIGISRYPAGNIFSDFNANYNHEKYLGVAQLDNWASGDVVQIIGRFGATLSAGAGYTWTVPTFTGINLVQRPIYSTRKLSYAPTFTGFSANPTGIYSYEINNNLLTYIVVTGANGTSNATTFTMTLPFASTTGGNSYLLGTDNGGSIGGCAYLTYGGGATTALFKTTVNGAWTNSGAKGADFILTFPI